MSYRNWIDEEQAAKMVNRKPRTLRKLVKSGKLKIAYSAPLGRKFHYLESDIIKLFKQNQTA